MRFWILQHGEPLPIDQEGLRVWRSGILAETLRDRGHEVTWWASNFRHLTHTHRYPGETFVNWNGIRLALVHSPGYPRNVSVQRLWDHHVLGRNLAEAMEREPPPDLIHCGYPSVETCEAAVEYAQDRGIPTVIDVRDLWPDVFRDLLPRRLVPAGLPAIGWLRRRSGRMLRRATAIHGITPAYVRYGTDLAGREPGPLDRDFPFGYRNETPDAKASQAAEAFWGERGVTGSDNPLTVCFFGNLNTERPEIDFDTGLRGLRIALERGASVRLVLGGKGRVADRVARECADLGERVIVPGFLNAAQILALMQRSHIGWVPYLPSPDFAASLPNKSIEYLAGGLPVITSLTEGEVRERFGAAGCLTTYESGRPEQFADALVALASDRDRLAEMAACASRLFESAFRAEQVYGDLAVYLEDLAKRTRHEQHA